MNKYRAGLGAGVATGVLILTSACGGVSVSDSSKDSSSGSSSGAASGSPRSLLPDDVRSSGVLTWATDDHLPPFVFKEGSADKGSTYDLVEAMGKVLGVKIRVLDTQFGSLITALQSNRADFSGGDFTDTEEREQTVSFVDYEKTDHKILVQSGNPEGVKGLTDTCGKTAGSSTGGLDAVIEQDQSKACVKQGKPKVDVKLFDSPSSAVTALEAGRIDVVAEEDQPGAYAARTTGKIEQVGPPVAKGVHGLAVAKSRTDLLKAMQAALNQLIKDGTYDKILKKWDAQDTALSAATINGALS